MRNPPNSRKGGESWTKADIQSVWNSGKVIPGLDPQEYRKDKYGALIRRSEYGIIAKGNCGWHIDHIQPVIEGGSDEFTNLQPLHWYNNTMKSDHWPFEHPKKLAQKSWL